MSQSGQRVPNLGRTNRERTGSAQRLKDRQLAPASLVDQAIGLIAHGRQLQAVEQQGEVVMVLAHQKPPLATASYSAGGRNSAGGMMGDGLCR